MATASPYVVLGLATSATVADVRAAFKACALAHHPDKQPPGTPAAALADAAARLDAVVAAARLLSDPLRRAAFDARSVQAAVRTEGRVSDTVDFRDFAPVVDEEAGDDPAAPPRDDATLYEHECRCGGAYVVVGPSATVRHAECDCCSLVIAVTPS